MTTAIAVNINDSSSLKWAFPYPEVEPERPRRIVLRWSPLPTWFGPVIDRVNELDALPTFDARGNSQPLSIDDVIDALDFMHRVMRDDTVTPWIGRLGTGGVQVTWQAGDAEVEAVFDRARAEQEVMVSVGDNEWDAPAAEAESLFATVVDRLSNSYVEYTAA